MKRSRFTQEQIIGVLKEHQASATAPDLCRKYGISEATFYAWRSKYGGMAQSLGSDQRRGRLTEKELGGRRRAQAPSDAAEEGEAEFRFQRRDQPRQRRLAGAELPGRRGDRPGIAHGDRGAEQAEIEAGVGRHISP